MIDYSTGSVQILTEKHLIAERRIFKFILLLTFVIAFMLGFCVRDLFWQNEQSKKVSQQYRGVK